MSAQRFCGAALLLLFALSACGHVGNSLLPATSSLPGALAPSVRDSERRASSDGPAVQDGQGPLAGLVAVNGVLYGTTSAGGLGHGTVFSITTDGSENVLYRFKGGSDGANPEAGLLAINGVLYGTTAAGGS